MNTLNLHCKKKRCKTTLLDRSTRLIQTNLNVKEGGGIDGDAVLLLKILGHFHLILLLDRLDGSLETGIIGQFLQLSELVQVGDPILADVLSNTKRGWENVP